MEAANGEVADKALLVTRLRGGDTVAAAEYSSPPRPIDTGFWEADSMSEPNDELKGLGESEEGGTWAEVLHVAEGIHLTNRGDVMEIPDEPPGVWISFRTLWAYTGPGFLMCIAYLDPGNLEADLQMGAYTGYQLMWVLLSSTLLGLVLQSIAARIGVVTGQHLAELCRMRYPRPASLCLWVMTELAIIGSDIQEVLGSAIALQILLGVPLWAGCVITAVDTFTFLFMHVFGVRKLEGLFVLLVAVMTVSFFINYGKEPPTASEVLPGLFPSMSRYAAIPALGLIGAVIMPHNLYLHSALVLSRAIDRADPRKLWEAAKYYTIDSAMALTVAFFINFAVVCTFAVQFFDPVCAVESTLSACLSGAAMDTDQSVYGVCDEGRGVCQQIGLSHAGEALRGALGDAAKYVWAVGLLAAGQSSTMTGTYAGQFVFEGFLKLKIPQWQRLLLTRGVALGPALLVTIALRRDDTATDRVSEWLNVLQSVQLPFALIPLLHFGGSAAVMGQFAIGRGLKALAWSASVFIIGVNCFIVATYLADDRRGSLPAPAFFSLAGAVAVAYICFCGYLMWDDLLEFAAFCNGGWRRSGRRSLSRRSSGPSGLAKLSPAARVAGDNGGSAGHRLVDGESPSGQGFLAGGSGSRPWVGAANGPGWRMRVSSTDEQEADLGSDGSGSPPADDVSVSSRSAFVTAGSRGAGAGGSITPPT